MYKKLLKDLQMFPLSLFQCTVGVWNSELNMNIMLYPFKNKSNTIELTVQVHPSCYCILDYSVLI